MEKTTETSYLKLDSIDEKRELTVNQLIDVIRENFKAMDIMGNFRLTEISEKLADFKRSNSAGGNLKVENTIEFIKELREIKKSTG